MPKPRSDGFLASAIRYTSVAMTLPSAVVAGYLIGLGLDSWFHTKYLKIVFLLLGIAAGFYELIRQLMRDMKSQEGDGKSK